MRFPVEGEPTTTGAKTRGHHDLLRSLLLQRGKWGPVMGSWEKHPLGSAPEQMYVIPIYQTGILNGPEVLELKLFTGTTSHDVTWRKINEGTTSKAPAKEDQKPLLSVRQL